MKTRHELLEAAQHQLELWDHRLTELEHELGAKAARARRETVTELKRLRKERRALAGRLDSAKDAAAEGWMQLEGDLADAVETFRESASRVLEEAQE